MPHITKRQLNIFPYQFFQIDEFQAEMQLGLSLTIFYCFMTAVSQTFSSITPTLQEHYKHVWP